MKPSNNPPETQPKPNKNPTETQPKPNGNQMESDAKVFDNLSETQPNDGCFIFKSIVENIELMPSEVSMKFYAAIVRYGIFNTIPNFEGIEMACFNSIRAQIDASNRRRNTQIVNGLKGGRPRKNPTETQPKPNRNPIITQQKPNTNPTQTLTSNKKQVTSNKKQVTSNDDDPPTPLETEVDDDAEKKIEAAEAVIVSWNSIVENVLPKTTTGNSHVMPLRTQRIIAMLDYFNNNMAKVNELFQKIVISPFLTGRKKTKDGHTFRARLEWLIETSENWVKVMDGYYDEHTAVPSHPECVLGAGEYINADGLRTYGSGKVIVPWDMPPRPSENYYCDSLNKAWAV